MLFFHSSSRARSRPVVPLPMTMRQRLAVRHLAEAVAVAVLVAEAVEELHRQLRIVRDAHRHAALDVPRHHRRNRLRRLDRLALVPDVDQLLHVEAHDDRAPQRDLVGRVAADDRVLHVEVRVGERGPRGARVAHALLRRSTASAGRRCRARWG